MTLPDDLGTPSLDDRTGRGVVERIVAYVCSARESPVAQAERRASVRAIFDLLGAVAAGFEERGPVAARAVVYNTMAAGDSPVWFAGESSSTNGAAWANSAAASALDLDDGHRLARGHPGAAVIPTAFAVAAERDVTFDELINAIVIGYEVGVTIAAARTTYGNTGTWAPFAVVATAATLRGTSPEVLAHALAIAGQSAPNQLFSSAPNLGVYAPEGSAVKEGIPWSVVTGLSSLDLAEAGYTGPRNILDSPAHYRFPAELALGSSPHICNTYFKVYACCRHVHAPLDAVLQVVEKYQIDPANIDLIEVETTSGALRITNRVDPANLIDVQFSIPYCLALALTRGPEVLLPLTPDVLGQEDVVALAGAVRLTLNSEFDDRFPAETLARVTVTSGGKRMTSEVTTPKGEASRPLSWAQVEAKFRVATRLTLTRNQQDRLVTAVEEGRAGDLAGVMAALSDVTLGVHV